MEINRRPEESGGREFALLGHPARHPGKVFTRAQLLKQVWGVRYDAYEHTVSSHINCLRAKLEPDPSNFHYIETIRPQRRANQRARTVGEENRLYQGAQQYSGETPAKGPARR